MSTCAEQRFCARTSPSDPRRSPDTAGDGVTEASPLGQPALRSVLVVGTGLIGTSAALALVAAGVDVHLVDADEGRARLAADLGAGRVGQPTEDPDLVIAAVPPAAVAAVIQAFSRTYLQSTFTDVASVASIPQRDIESLGGSIAQRYVGGHPMAGRERSGPAAARPDLFLDRPWVLTPTVLSSGPALDHAVALVRLCGADLVQMSPPRHDEAVALVSHVPQLVASLTAARLDGRPDDLVALAGQGVRDVTRIAASDPGLWTGILDANAAAVLPVIRELQAQLNEVEAALSTLAATPLSTSLDIEQAMSRQIALSTLLGVLGEGNAGYARIPGKHGGRPAEFAIVTVLVPDRPRELARIFAAAGDADVNVEDVVLEHASGHPVGTVMLYVQPAAVPVLVQALTEQGWTVHA
jgi:prephenate dehydrogenase